MVTSELQQEISCEGVIEQLTLEGAYLRQICMPPPVFKDLTGSKEQKALARVLFRKRQKETCTTRIRYLKHRSTEMNIHWVQDSVHWRIFHYLYTSVLKCRTFGDVLRALLHQPLDSPPFDLDRLLSNDLALFYDHD